MTRMRKHSMYVLKIKVKMYNTVNVKSMKFIYWFTLGFFPKFLIYVHIVYDDIFVGCINVVNPNLLLILNFALNFIIFFRGPFYHYPMRLRKNYK